MLGPCWQLLGVLEHLGAFLERSRAYFEAILINMEHKTKGRNWIFEKPSKTTCFFLFFESHEYRFGISWGSFWGHLGALGAILEVSWGDLGGLLGVLTASWDVWERLGVSDHRCLCLRAGPGPQTIRSSGGKFAFLGAYCRQ